MTKIKYGVDDEFVLGLFKSGKIKLVDGVVTHADGRPATLSPNYKKDGSGDIEGMKVVLNSKRIGLARVVLIGSVGLPPFENAAALFKDGGRQNHHPDNLRWGTLSEVASSRASSIAALLRRNAAAKKKEDMPAESNPRPKLNKQQQAEIVQKRLFTTPAVSVAVLADEYKVGIKAIYATVRRYKERQQEKENNNNGGNSDG